MALKKTSKDIRSKDRLPSRIEPMLATLAKDFPAGDDWIYEIKWDGYRIIAVTNKNSTRLLSRSNLDFTKNYQIIADELTHLKLNGVIDGELVVLDEEGQPNFDMLQRYAPGMSIVFYAFDVLWLNNKDLQSKSLLDRKKILEQMIPEESEFIKYSDHFEDGRALFEQVSALSLEGIVAKKKDSDYQRGKRTKNWLKLPTAIRQEFVIGGWTFSENGKFRSLLFGYYEKGKLIYLGHAGLGYKSKDIPSMLSQLKKLEIKKSPFSNAVDIDHETHFIRPELVAEIKFSTFTESGKIRKPAVFLGFRKDKNPKEVGKEVEITEPIDVASSFKESIKPDKESNWRVIQALQVTSSDEVDIDGKKVVLQNVEKEIWHGITKADLIQYYHTVAKYMLPYLQDRPQSIHIKHQGVTKPGLYIKDMEGQQPEWAEIFSIKRKHKKAGRRDIIDYLVCNDEATLLYMINLGCIDINPWNARTTDPYKPDYIVVDLDPSDDDFKKVITTAIAAKEVFKKYKLVTFPKTSGKTGMHLYLPCSAFDFPQARDIAEKLCEEIHDLVPEITTTAVTISQRGSRLYIDPNQNDEADTLAAPYSARPYHLPTVSTPLNWNEITGKLDPHAFTIKTILKRIEKKGDLFRGVLSKENVARNDKALRKF
jgi:bifunctional non-homologous end joining protein LigD